MRIAANKVEVIMATKMMTKAELSRECGIKSQNIAAIMKKGTCEPRTLGKIAHALGVDVEELIAKEA